VTTNMKSYFAGFSKIRGYNSIGSSIAHGIRFGS